MTHGSLFSGIGGFDLAAEWMGWGNVFHCEMNPFGRKVLHHYWPNSISYEDITRTDFTIHRGTIDILTGGFPCQPYSHAGKRLGKEDSRHLWPEMLRAIREIQPTWVVGENVSGLISWNGGLVFHEVQTDLEAEGYEVQPFVLPACAVNAPHRRDRVWFIAHSGSAGTSASSKGCDQSRELFQEGGWEQNKQQHQSIGTERPTTNPDSAPTEHPIPTGGNVLAGNDRIITNTGLFGQTERQQQPMGADELRKERHATDTCNQGLQGSEVNGSVGIIGQERNKQLAGCVPSTWQIFPTQPPVCSRNDGLPTGLVGITVSKHRNESIKAYGNAIVPQVALQIFKAIQTIQSHHPSPTRPT